ncbi:MAG TPA: D-Ala-D-Ala carboxypeptidase family metallohydrolase [Thermodesulfobacteriota bacterium]|nr:D-Ala-D-Ala carboxypeptidase family metallohydrolase [Thermodesulfobacteriota bacterium]
MRTITLEDYVMNRDTLFPQEWEIAYPNAVILLEKVNNFLQELNLDFGLAVSSGFRPKEINDKLSTASKRSLHTIGKAIDLADTANRLKDVFMPQYRSEDADLLRKYGLFMEHPAHTPGWIHLDIGDRIDRPTRCFIP